MTLSLSERSKKLAEEAKKIKGSDTDYAKLAVETLNAADHGEDLKTA